MLQKVWNIAITIHVLDNEGNMMDAGLLAAIGALMTSVHADTTVSGDDILMVRCIAW
jgi:exosome complex RNA-binding protein Rrp42 (RNase PH superfamily)